MLRLTLGWTEDRVVGGGGGVGGIRESVRSKARPRDEGEDVGSP